MPLTANDDEITMTASEDLTQLPTSRKAAKESGSPYYCTGNPCSRGHVCRRNTKSGRCRLCDIVLSAGFRKERPEYSAGYNKKYYEKNKQNLIDRAKNYYEENKHWLKDKKRDHYFANKEKYNLAGKKHYQENIEKYREYNLKYREDRLEELRKKDREWYKANPEIVKQRNRNCKARRKGAEGKFTNDDVKNIFNRQKGKCINCLKNIAKEYHVDHVIPIKLGGTNWPNNLQLLCPTCNLKKNAKHPIKWAQEQGRLL